MPSGPGRVDEADIDPEQPQQHRRDVDEGNGARGRDDPGAKAGSRPDRARSVQHQHRDHRGQGQRHRLKDDAGVADLVHRGKPAQHQSLERRIKRAR